MIYIWITMQEMSFYKNHYCHGHKYRFLILLYVYVSGVFVIARCQNSCHLAYILSRYIFFYWCSDLHLAVCFYLGFRWSFKVSSDFWQWKLRLECKIYITVAVPKTLKSDCVNFSGETQNFSKPSRRTYRQEEKMFTKLNKSPFDKGYFAKYLRRARYQDVQYSTVHIYDHAKFEIMQLIFLLEDVAWLILKRIALFSHSTKRQLPTNIFL